MLDGGIPSGGNASTKVPQVPVAILAEFLDDEDTDNEDRDTNVSFNVTRRNTSFDGAFIGKTAESSLHQNTTDEAEKKSNVHNEDSGGDFDSDDGMATNDSDCSWSPDHETDKFGTKQSPVKSPQIQQQIQKTESMKSGQKETVINSLDSPFTKKVSPKKATVDLDKTESKDQLPAKESDSKEAPKEEKKHQVYFVQ